MSKSEEWMIPDESDLDDALGQAIGEAMEPERCDSDEFAAGIRERIEGAEGRASRLSGVIRAAAALVPPLLLPKGLAKGGSLAGGAVLKGSGWKAAPGFAAFPALVVVMIALTLALAVQRMFVRGPQRFARMDAQAQVNAWWKRFIIPVVGVLAVLVWRGMSAPLDATLLFVVLSMGVLVGILGSLARAGFATRREVGMRTGSFLVSLLQFGFVIFGFVELMEPGQVGVQWTTTLLMGGALTCHVLGWLDNATDKASWHAWAWISSVGIILLPLALLFFFVGGRSGKVQVTRAQALEFLEGKFLDSNSMGFQARNLASIAWYLGTDGGRTPDLQVLNDGIHDWIDRNPPSKDGKAGVNYLSLIDATYLGLLRDEDFRLFRSEYKQRVMFEKDGPMRSPEHEYMQIKLRQLENPLSESECDLIAGRVLRGAQEYPQYAGASDLVVRMMILEDLGRFEDVEQLREKAHAQLLATWAVQLDGSSGCFVTGAENLEPSERVPEPLKRLYSGWLSSCDYSFRLMIRFGVPEGVDLHLFDTYLAGVSNRHRIGELRDDHAQAAAMRSLLHSIHEWEPLPPPTRIQELKRYRLFCSVLLLVLFCVFVTMRTPKSVAGSGGTKEREPTRH